MTGGSGGVGKEMDMRTTNPTVPKQGPGARGIRGSIPPEIMPCCAVGSWTPLGANLSQGQQGVF